MDIQNKTILVTGANRGIGKAIVEAFLAAGANKVYAAVRTPSSADELVKAYGSKVVPIELDLSKQSTITAAANAAKDVDIVINNAGVLTRTEPLQPDALENLAHEIDVNVYGLLRMAQAFAPVLKNNGGGAFVQVNSVVSLTNFESITTYSASKAAAYSITQGLRDSLRTQNTHVLSVHPGPIDTDMARSAGLEGEPPSVVAQGIIEKLQAGEFFLFPDSMAQDMGRAYQSFAENVVLAEAAEA